MSNETKRDVFIDAVYALADAQASGGNIGHQDANLFMAEYDAALPDDLPVIPKVVGDWIAWRRGRGYSLKDALNIETRVSERTVALAWVLGVWRVEENGEIVKLEAEK